MSRDPSTETWRDAVGLSTSARLRQTQRDLAASQADLSHVERQLADAELERMKAECERDEARRELEHATQCAWRGLAVTAMRERDEVLAQNDIHGRQLGSAAEVITRLTDERDYTRAQLDRLIAEFGRERTWAVADRTNIRCASCERPIRRGQAFQSLADAKGYFAHVYCEIEGATT